MNATIQNPIKKLVATLDEQRARKRDLILPASKLKMTTSLNMEVSVNDALGSSEYFAPNELMETQLAEKLGIPMNYYRKMKGVIPNLLTENVNGWLGFVIEYEDETSLKFHYLGNLITLFPYSGWFSGKGIKDGRGLKNLLGQISPN